MHEQDKNEEQFKAFASFIAHWPIHKPNTPPELHEILDQVYLQYRFSQDKEIFRTSTKDLLDSVISFLQSKKQQAEAPTSHTQASFWHTIITCDIGNLISSIADVAYKIWKIQHQEKQDNSSWNTYIHIN